jgi:Mg-chelatase subunit ChlD
MSACCNKSSPRRAKKQKGYILVMGALILFFILVPAAGLAIDVGLMYLVQTLLSAASDGAALAGARALSRGSNDAAQSANAEATANTYFRANFPTAYMWSSNLHVTSVAATDATNLRSITTSASVDLPLIFLRIFNMNSTTVSNVSKATRRDANIIIVMDRSGSLANSGSCTPLKAAAVGFVDKFAEGRDYMGLITFATSSKVDQPMATTFKTSVEGTLNSVTCVGATSTAQAIWQGYDQLVALNQAGALNALVLFTDGLPTAITGTFPILSTSTCTSQTPKLGVLTEGGVAYGLFVKDAPQPIGQDMMVIADKVNCYFKSNQSKVNKDVQSAPTTDYWGNSLTTTGYKSVIYSGSGLSISSWQNIDNFSTNAADHAALRVRRGDPDPAQGNRSLPGVVIFTIGLGADVDSVLLKRIANDPTLTPNPVAAGAQGRYEYAGDATALNDAFLRVASEVLRLAQ